MKRKPSLEKIVDKFLVKYGKKPYTIDESFVNTTSEKVYSRIIDTLEKCSGWVSESGPLARALVSDLEKAGVSPEEMDMILEDFSQLETAIDTVYDDLQRIMMRAEMVMKGEG